MSDDSFFREVGEELRQDRIKAIWTRFGVYILIAVVLVVVVTAGVIGWDRYQTSRENEAGDAYLAALKLAETDKTTDAIAALQVLADGDVGAYPDLARMSIGSVHAKAGDAKAAIAAFDQVAKDGDAPQPIRDMADLRAAYLLVDAGSLADVQSHAERLTGDSQPLRFAAREAIALAAWKAGDVQTAQPLFRQLADDAGTPSGVAGRARLMLEVIAADTPAASEPAAGEGTPEEAANEAGSADQPAQEPTSQAETPADEGNGPAAGNAAPVDAGPAPATAPADETSAAEPDASGVAPDAAMPTTDLGTETAAPPAASDPAPAPGTP